MASSVLGDWRGQAIYANMYSNMKHAHGPVSEIAVLLITTIATFMVPVMTSGINIALPTIGRDFNLDVVTLGWVTTTFQLASAALLLPVGRIADLYGRKRVFAVGSIIFAVGCFLAAVSISGPILLVSRAIQGIGGGAVFSTAIVLLISTFSPGERGRALGINTATAYLGLSTGPFLGGLLTHYIGWRSIFLLGFVLSLVVIVATFWKLRGELSPVEKGNLDLGGSVIYTLALVATMYGLTILPGVRGIGLIAAGIAGGLVFFWWETRTKEPILNLGLFRGNAGFTFSNLAALINYSGTWAVSFLLSLYLQYNKGFDPQTAGIILVCNPVIQAIFSPITGRLSDRIEPRILASLGMAVSTLGIGLLALLNESTSIGYLLGCLAFLGFGFALFSSPNTNAIMSSADRRSYGVASAILATSRQVGMLLSMATAMLVFGATIGPVEITKENAPALLRGEHITFIIFTILSFSAIFASLARGNIHKNPHQRPVAGTKS